MIEQDAVLVAQNALVIGFELGLSGRQRRSLRVVDQIEDQIRSRDAIAERVEALECADRGVEDAFAALPVDIVFEIAGHRRGDLDLLTSEKFREILLTGDVEDGQIAAIDDVDAKRSCAPYQRAKVRVELGRAAGDVERRECRGVRARPAHARSPRRPSARSDEARHGRGNARTTGCSDSRRLTCRVARCRRFIAGNGIPSSSGHVSLIHASLSSSPHWPCGRAETCTNSPRRHPAPKSRLNNSP